MSHLGCDAVAEEVSESLVTVSVGVLQGSLNDGSVNLGMDTEIQDNGIDTEIQDNGEETAEGELDTEIQDVGLAGGLNSGGELVEKEFVRAEVETGSLEGRTVELVAVGGLQEGLEAVLENMGAGIEVVGHEYLKIEKEILGADTIGGDQIEMGARVNAAVVSEGVEQVEKARLCKVEDQSLADRHAVGDLGEGEPVRVDDLTVETGGLPGVVNDVMEQQLLKAGGKVGNSVRVVVTEVQDEGLAEELNLNQELGDEELVGMETEAGSLVVATVETVAVGGLQIEGLEFGRDKHLQGADDVQEESAVELGVTTAVKNTSEVPSLETTQTSLRVTEESISREGNHVQLGPVLTNNTCKIPYLDGTQRMDSRMIVKGTEVGCGSTLDLEASIPETYVQGTPGYIPQEGSDTAVAQTIQVVSRREDNNMDTDGVCIGESVLADVASSEAIMDGELQTIDTHLTNENILDSADTFMENIALVEDITVVERQSIDTHLITENSGEGDLSVSNSSLAVESLGEVTCPLDENSVERGSIVKVPCFVVNTTMPHTLLLSEVAARPPQGNESSVSIDDEQDVGALSANCLANQSHVADAHEKESSIDRDPMNVDANGQKEGLPAPDVDLAHISVAEQQSPLPGPCMADGITDEDTIWLGEHELFESSDEQIQQPETVVPWTLYYKSSQQARYNLPPQDATKFSVSDLVWGKVQSYPWWPGQIFDQSHASKLALKHQKKDNFLVAYFGDDTFAWRDKYQLKPFYASFSQMEKQSNTDTFIFAVNESLGEVSRRMEAGMTCSCLREACADTNSQRVEHAGNGKGTTNPSSDKSLVMNNFDCSRLLEYIKALAQIATGGADRLDLVIAKTQLKAFYRSKGYPELPEFIFDRGLGENDVTVSASSEKKPIEFVIEQETPLASELMSVKRKRGRPPKEQKNVLYDVKVLASWDEKPKEVDIEDSTPLANLLHGKTKRGRSRKKQRGTLIDVEVSETQVESSEEFVVEHSRPLVELLLEKRKKGRPLKKQKDTLIDVEVSASTAKSSEEFVAEHSTPLAELLLGTRKRGRPLTKQRGSLNDVELSASAVQTSKESVVEHSPLSSLELIPTKRKRGRPPKKQKHLLEYARKEKSLAELMEEKIVSRLGKSGSDMKSDRSLSNLPSSSSSKKFKVSDFDSASAGDSESESGSTDSRKPKKRRSGVLTDLDSNPSSSDLLSSFDIEKGTHDSGESKRKMIGLVVDLEKKSRNPILNGSFKIGEYMRRGASRLTGLPPILKSQSDTTQKPVVETDCKTGRADPDASPSAPFFNRRRKLVVKDNDISEDSKQRRKTGGRRGREKVEFESASTDMSIGDSDWSDEITAVNSGKGHESNSLKGQGTTVTHRQTGKKMPAVHHDELLSQLCLAASDPLKGDTFLSTVISFFTDFRDSCASTPAHMKDSFWSSMISVDSSEQEQISNGPKQQTKKKKVAEQASSSCFSGPKDSARHKQFRAGTPSTRPALPAERSIITVEEKIVDTPTSLILNFNSPNSLPSEADLIKIFGQYGPLRESETEIMVKINRAKVVFKRRADAEIAFSSAGKFSIFGPTLLSYQLKYLPSAPKPSPDSPRGQSDQTSIKENDLEISGQKEIGAVLNIVPEEAVAEE